MTQNKTRRIIAVVLSILAVAAMVLGAMNATITGLAVALNAIVEKQGAPAEEAAEAPATEA